MNYLLLSILVLLSWTQSCFALEINFLPHADITGASITLEDLVSFDEKTELSSALGSRIVAKSPQPGESIALQSKSIVGQITRQLSLPPSTRWRGSSTIKVTRKGQKIGPDQLLHIVESYLKNNKNILPKAEIHFRATSLPLPFMLPLGDISWQVTPSSPSIIRSSSVSVIMEVDGRVRKNISLKGHIEVLAPVAVASSSLKRGSILTSNNTSLEKKDIAKIRNPALNLREILGKKLKRSIRAGRAISTSDLDFPPVVKKGQLVKILANLGNLHLTATGIARTDGKLNQVIRVRNVSSNKLIFCRVAAPGIVEVQI